MRGTTAESAAVDSASVEGAQAVIASARIIAPAVDTKRGVFISISYFFGRDDQWMWTMRQSSASSFKTMVSLLSSVRGLPSFWV